MAISCPCSVCRYSLTGLDPEAPCPECGATSAQRQVHAKGQRRVRRWMTAYALLVLPSWCELLVLVVGWSVAHLLIGIPNPHWVQHGEHRSLDVLGAIAMLASLAFIPSILVAPLVTPWVLFVVHRSYRNTRDRWAAYAIMAVLFVPVMIGIAMFRPLGGPPLGLVDWIPD